MHSISRKLNSVNLPLIVGEHPMIRFDLMNTSTLDKVFKKVADSMLSMVAQRWTSHGW